MVPPQTGLVLPMSVPEKSFEPGAGCPLDGVRVVDMSRLVSGNMVSLQLADFGAEVIKIEDPKTGDPLRAWQTGGVSVHWKVYSRNKKSVALNLRAPRGRELLADLVPGSQVLIENFRPGTIEAMGLPPDELHRRNPGLIIVRVSGWGQDGPYRDRPGFGTLVESMSGYAARTGFADREPALPPTALADMVAGLYGAMAVMVALREVETKGGNGQIIDLPLLDPLFSFIATEAAIYRLTGAVRERTGSRSETTSPRNVFRTQDGRYIGISASIQAMAERLFRAIGPRRHDRRPAVSHQQRPGEERRSLRGANRRLYRRAHFGPEHGDLRTRRGHRGTGLRHRPVHGRPACAGPRDPGRRARRRDWTAADA
jgi:crotonobetainyl-CoA:carnitine CoA-transferase CaiB-like acyl-CoA transferase